MCLLSLKNVCEVLISDKVGDTRACKIYEIWTLLQGFLEEFSKFIFEKNFFFQKASLIYAKICYAFLLKHDLRQELVLGNTSLPIRKKKSTKNNKKLLTYSILPFINFKLFFVFSSRDTLKIWTALQFLPDVQQL